jgi:Protein of unknown function (DUF3237)
VRLEHLYRLRFSYPEAWEIGAGNGTRQSYGLAEGRCQGRVSGRFRGANHARIGTDGATAHDFHGFITTEDGATVLFDYRGRGRSRADGGFDLVATAMHLADDERYAYLNDVVCALEGGIQPGDEHVEIDVYEVVWEPIAE